MKIESVSERAQRKGCTVGYVYQELRACRIPGARKNGGRWSIPVEPPVVDYKSRAAGDDK
jgi:hypothetical protein